jgi:hypothetical protein
VPNDQHTVNIELFYIETICAANSGTWCSDMVGAERFWLVICSSAQGCRPGGNNENHRFHFYRSGTACSESGEGFYPMPVHWHCRPGKRGGLQKAESMVKIGKPFFVHFFDRVIS